MIENDYIMQENIYREVFMLIGIIKKKMCVCVCVWDLILIILNTSGNDSNNDKSVLSLKKWGQTRTAVFVLWAQWLLRGLEDCSIVLWLLSTWTNIGCTRKREGPRKRTIMWLHSSASLADWPLSCPVTETSGSLNGCQSPLTNHGWHKT